MVFEVAASLLVLKDLHNGMLRDAQKPEAGSATHVLKLLRGGN